MAALIGYMKGQAGEVSRLGSARSGIRARLETWQGSATLELLADGNFTLRIGAKSETGRAVVHGNVDIATVETCQDV